MAVPRSKSQRERDRLLISDLYLQGFNQQEIAEKLNLHRNTVNSDIRFLLNEWKKKRDSVPNEFEAKYRYIYREAIAAWQRSKEDAVTEIQEATEGGAEGGGQRLKASTRRVGQSGNPALLAQAQAALKAIREMFGVDAPIKFDWQIEIINLIRQGTITPQDVLDELGDGVETRQLLESAGVLTIEGRAVEVASEEKTAE